MPRASHSPRVPFPLFTGMSVAVLGGGLSGLAAAYFVQREALRRGATALRVHVFEREPRTGGWVRSGDGDGGDDAFFFEKGPRTLQPRTGESMVRLVHALGLEDKVVLPSDDAKARFLWTDGAMVQLGGQSLWEAARDPLLRAMAMGVLREPLQAMSGEEDESIYSFARRRFGVEVADKAVTAMVKGIFGGDAKQLSVRSCFHMLYNAEVEDGSVLKHFARRARDKAIAKKQAAAREQGAGGPSEEEEKEGEDAFVERMMRAPMYSFEGGMETLTSTLRAQAEAMGVQVHTGKRVHELHHDSDGRVQLVVGDTHGGGDARETHTTQHVISTLPSFALAPLVRKQHPSLALALESIAYANLGVVNVGYTGDVAEVPRAFGHLVPDADDVMGVVYDSRIFPDAAGNTRLTVMLGGAGAPGLVDKGREHVRGAALDGLQRQLGITRTPDYTDVILARRCIPQYAVGHHRTVAEVEEHVARFLPQLTMSGTALYGVSCNDCVQRQLDVTPHVLTRVTSE